MRGVPALRHKDVRRFFFGQFISNVGSWMQIVALGWLIFQTTNSAFWVGVVAASSSIPAVFFSLFGGWIVDHFPKKNVLILANSASMILAFILGLLVIFGYTSVPVIITISLLGGIINSIFTPAHFSYISEIVNKDDLASAMSINASVSSLGRILGPIAAGLYIKLGGLGGSFIVNGFSYLAVIIAIYIMKSPRQAIDQHLNPLKAISEGLVYAYSNPMIRAIIIYVGAASIFAWSYTTIIPVIAKNIFHADATGMSYFYSSIGLGALASTFIAAFLAHRVSKLILFISGNTLFALSVLLLSFTNNFILGLICLFIAGLGLVLINIVLGTMVQHLAEPEFRGRVSSIYFFVYGGVIFIGNLEIGYLTEHLGPQMAIQINTSMMLAIGIIIILFRNKLRQTQVEYNSSLIHE